MKKIVLLLAILTVSAGQAQFKVKMNGKPVAENATIKAEDIKTLDVAFDKPKTLKYYGTGRLILGVALIGTKTNQLVEEYVIKKNGSNAVETFLADVNVYHNLVTDANGDKLFVPRVLNYSFLDILQHDDDETIKVEINLMFFDKIGYEKFGEPIPLVKKFVFTIDNKTNAAAYIKKQEERKAKEDAERAERDKANEEARKAEEAKNTKKKAGGLLRGLIGK